MSYKEAFFKANIQGIIALIIIFFGFYGLLFNESTADIKICIAGLMGTVTGYYFGASKAKNETTNKEEK